MSSSIRHRLLNQMARNVAWTSSAWLAVMVGCVDAPQESFTPVETAATPASTTPTGELVQADLTETVVDLPEHATSQVAAEVTEPTPFDQVPATSEPQPTLASDEEAADTGPGLFPIPEPEADSRDPATDGDPLVPVPGDTEALSSPKPPTPATPQAAAEKLVPTPITDPASDSEEPAPAAADSDAAGPASAVPAPFPGASEPSNSQAVQPTEAAPTPAPAADTSEASVAEQTIPQPLPAATIPQAGQPAVNANASPTEVAQPKGYIHINPRQRTPENAAVPKASVNQNELGKLQPAVALPPSSGADAAALAPLPKSESSESEADSKPTDSTATSGIPVSTVSITATKPANSPEPEIPEGFIALFNQQDMTGWEVIDGKVDSWEFKDGVASCVAPGGGWIQTLAMYSDFELQFEYRLSPGGNSGVSLRYPGHGNPSLEGLEIQLIDDRAEKYKDIQPLQATGSLYFAAAPQVRDAAEPAGTWNRCRVRCAGTRLEVTINDTLVNEIDLTQINTRVDGVARPVAAVRSPMGSIALQSHSTRVDFRGVILRDLTQVLASGVRWLDLQEGNGEAAPPGAKVTVHYIGHLSTGKRFANSVEKEKPVTVELRDVIPGWREGIPGMKVGGKRRLVVPPAMAYGEKGFKEVVPPNSTLVYEIELLEFAPGEDEVPLEAADASPAETSVK